MKNTWIFYFLPNNQILTEKTPNIISFLPYIKKLISNIIISVQFIEVFNTAWQIINPHHFSVAKAIIVSRDKQGFGIID